MIANPFANVWRQFEEATRQHELATLHSDGLYRHYRMKKPGTGIWHWDIITWPDHLCIDGDIGGGLVFSRDPDMIEFFRSGLRYGMYSDGAPMFAIGYWAEKLSRGPKSVRTYSPDVFMRQVNEALIVGPAGSTEVLELSEVAKSVAEFEHEAREWLDQERRAVGYDTWEWDLTDWDHHFILSCYAIAATVKAVPA